MKKEIWKSVVGYEGYYKVSNKGRVRSLSRKVRSKSGFRHMKGRILKQCDTGDGYLMIGLCKKGKPRSRFAHLLVLEAFVGPRPKEKEACHQDCDKSNNSLDNLRWDTREANRADTKRMGRAATGERNGNATLTNEEREEIKKLKGVLPVSRIACLYGVWCSTIYHVLDEEN